MSRKVFFSVGEPSGDLHGANLMQAMRRSGDDWQFLGFGGPRMAQAGCQLTEDLTQQAIMGVSQVITRIPKFWKLYRQADRILGEQRPEAVVMIDYPGFNWWVARAAKRHGIPVFYYGVPQMWAWGSWRVKKMRRLIDHTLCKLPFEKDWYQQRGCRATYVGHPYFDELANRPIDETFAATLRDRPLVTLLPGSRRLEVKYNWPMLRQAAAEILREMPDCRLGVACFQQKYADQIQADLKEHQDPVTAGIEVHVGRTPELISEATVCLACSGSVSLELLYHQKPSAIVFWAPWWRLALVKKFLLQVRYITLVNLLGTGDGFSGKYTPYDPTAPDADQVPMPEYLTSEDCSPQLAAHALHWLRDPAARENKVTQLGQIRETVAQPGASQRAAEYIVAQLQNASAPKDHVRGQRAA